MHDVHSARQAAEQGRLEEWVHAYLSSGAWADPAFVAGLRRQRRWWLGPLCLPLVAVTRVCGPEPDLEYPQAPVRWEAKVAAMAAEISDPLALPPFITEYRDGTLSLRDGNHRHAGKGHSVRQTDIQLRSAKPLRPKGNLSREDG